MTDSSDFATNHQDHKDPSVRTLETLHREIENLSERTEDRFNSEARLRSEKFDSVAREFELIERGRIEQKADTKQAVDAALIAQKEAVKEQTIASEKSIDKSETATAKQIDAQGVSFTQSMNAMFSSFNDLKERVVVIEAKDQGSFHERNERRMSMGQVTATITAGLLSVSIIVSTLIAVFHH